MIEKTKPFEMGANPVLKTQWAEYRAKVMAKWQKLLESRPAERQIQEFLEQHPSMIPGAHRSLLGRFSVCGHPGGVITQPPLKGLRRRVPDFMWIGQNSLTLAPIFIELERPDKRWFNSSNTPTAEATQAMSQLAEWRVWINEPAHKSIFMDYYGLTDYHWRSKSFEPIFILVMGRRKEFDGKPYLTQLRGQLQRTNEFHMTYDRLEPNENASDVICVNAPDVNSFKAVSWPACAAIGPSKDVIECRVGGLLKAVSSSSGLSPARKRFLKTRIPYWEAWRDRSRVGPRRIWFDEE